jgi:hypothetical protein
MSTTPTTRYAARTEVDPKRTREEIERLLERYGATTFSYTARPMDNYAAIEFELRGHAYRLYVRYPATTDRSVTHDGAGRRRPNIQAVEKARDQIVRQRWRALKLYINATLEAVTSGVTTMDEALFAHLVIPDTARRTMYEFLEDTRDEIARTGAPPALPAPRDDRRS